MEFSVRLKELRVDNDMSQTELARSKSTEDFTAVTASARCAVNINAVLIEHFRQLTYENKIRIDERIKTMADA